ncbi:MAG: ABC transporter ATP-binding protein [Lachnospiraceae bacterium]|nr:ABC transporter ATP-binding protein [Lachnospiraceae bacterium]
MRALKNCLFSMKMIFRYAPIRAAVSVFCIFVPAAFSGLQVLLLREIVDSALAYMQGRMSAVGDFAGIGSAESVGGMALQGMVLYGVLLVVLLALGSSLQRIGMYQMDYINMILMEKMAPDIAQQLMQLEYASFEEQGTQELFQKMSGSPENHVFNCAFNAMFALQRTITVIFSMSVIFVISPWIGLGIVLIGIPMLGLGYYEAGRSVAATEEAVDARRRMSDLKELLADKHAMYEMKLFGAEKLFADKWNDYSGRYGEIAARQNRKGMQVNVASRLLNAVYLIFVVCMAAVEFLEGDLTLGAFTAALNAVAGIGNQLNDCIRQVVWMLINAMEMDYYMQFLKLKTREDVGETDALAYYDIAFENVSFRYPGTEREVLRNVTFYIREGERIAFVGENGAGKSTIIKLLCGLYEPSTGTVTVGGIPVRDLTPGLRLRVLSVVFQDFQSYQLTLRENVAMGNLQSLGDDQKLLQALRMAGAEELADQGLDRNLGKLTEDGQDLSGGQWQRVAMARAFVSDAKYVILDEPTASLDPLAESRMYENFADIFRERGTIMISHRLASARMADRILVLDGGRIVQEGSHERLMQKEGLYRTMFLAQSSLYHQEQMQALEGGSVT